MSIADQLSEYCNCVDFTQKDVNELVSLVSMATCWQTETCEPLGDECCKTFLQGERQEVIDLPNCMDCVFEFEPFFHPYVVESFTFSLVKIDGVEETATPISDYAYSTLDGKFRIDLGLPSCKCSCNPCGCPPKYKLLVNYVAGYEKIPECLLPVFCNMLDVIHDKNKCECCNTDCGCGDGKEEIQYACGDVVTVAVETDLGKMVAELTKGMLGMMSLCREEPIWGVIV